MAADTQIAVREVASGDTAVALVKKYQDSGALVFVAPEDLRTQRMFLPEIVVLKALPTDFHDMPRKQKMAKSHHAHRMADASGTTFTGNCGTREGARPYVKIGWAQARRRMPDGTWRESPVLEYEFDPDLRCEEDILNHPDWYKSDTEKQKHLLELRKFATARASTGAELRVIRHLTGTPTTFSEADIQRAMVFSRIALNTDAMLDSPEMRDAAIAHAVGASNALFGPAPASVRNVTPAPIAITDSAPADEEPAGDDFGDAPEDTAPVVEDDTPEARARSALVDWAAHPKIAAYKPKDGRIPIDPKTLPAGMPTMYSTAVEAIMALVERKDATLAHLEAMVRRCAKIGGAS